MELQLIRYDMIYLLTAVMFIPGGSNTIHVYTHTQYSGTQALINSLVWENGYSQLVDSPNRGDALLDVYLVRPESSSAYSSRVQGISDHYVVILEVEWEQSGCEPQVERLVPMYNKTDVLGLQISSAINSQYGQATAVAWRRYGIISKI